MGATAPYPVRRTSDTRRGAFAKSCCLLRYCRSVWPMEQLSESFNTTNIASQIPQPIAMLSSHTCRRPCMITGSGYSPIKITYRRTFRSIRMDGVPETGTARLGCKHMSRRFGVMQSSYIPATPPLEPTLSLQRPDELLDFLLEAPVFLDHALDFVTGMQD